MKRMFAACSLLFLSITLAVPAQALPDNQVVYVGGTIAGFKEGALGQLDTTSPTALAVLTAANKLVIPYAAILSYDYTQPVAHHLGVLPAIAVGLLVHRQHRHVFRITYHGAGDSPEVLILEVHKQLAQPLFAILQARAPKPCPNRVRCGNAHVVPTSPPDSSPN